MAISYVDVKCNTSGDQIIIQFTQNGAPINLGSSGPYGSPQAMWITGSINGATTGADYWKATATIYSATNGQISCLTQLPASSTVANFAVPGTWNLEGVIQWGDGTITRTIDQLVVTAIQNIGQ